VHGFNAIGTRIQNSERLLARRINRNARRAAEAQLQVLDLYQQIGPSIVIPYSRASRNGRAVIITSFFLASETTDTRRVLASPTPVHQRARTSSTRPWKLPFPPTTQGSISSLSKPTALIARRLSGTCRGRWSAQPSTSSSRRSYPALARTTAAPS
jgi:hypothetical protein